MLVVLMLSYGAVGARQPAVRTSVPLGVPVNRLAETLAIPDLGNVSRPALDQ